MVTQTTGKTAEISEHCANCGGFIGAMEIGCVWQDRPVCYNCYNRLASSRPPIPGIPVEHVQTVEQTSKRWKLQMIIASALCVFGLILYAAAWPDTRALESLALVIMIGAAIWLIYIKFMIWWHHG